MYWLIALVVLLALAPLWQFIPSQRQRREARMREAAALAGLFVEFRDLPLPAARRERMPRAERQVIYYGRRLPPARRARRQAHSWWREGGDWRSERRLPGAPDIAAEMPVEVLAIGVTDTSCGCYWREEGDVAEVKEIAALLERWVSQLTARD